MAMEPINPYAAPHATVEDPVDSRGNIGEFPRFSAWWVFLLAVVTFSIYIPYWLYTRSQILNRIMPGDAVAAGLMSTAIALYVVSFLCGISEPFFKGNAAIKGISAVLNFASQISLLVWSFSLRNRLNRLLGAAPGDAFWLSGIVTFFFQIIYLQYKINEAIDSKTA